ncbi:PKD domain-containing protein [Methanospirillum sp.]
MSKGNMGFLSLKERKIHGLIIAVLISVTVIISIGSAVVIPKFTAANQFGMPIDISSGQGFFSCGDSITLKNASIIYQDPHDEIKVYRWFIDGNPIEGSSSSNTVTDKESFTAQLVADNYTGVQSSSAVISFHSKCGIISANFSKVPAYDDLSYDPNGSITFYDQSYSKLDPELDITTWWWKGENPMDTTGPVFSTDNHLKMKMPNKTGVTYNIDLVVGDSSGKNFTSWSEEVMVPPDNVIPIANFTVVPSSGIRPLNVSIIDQSLSMVNYTVSNVNLSYNYTLFKNDDAGLPSVLIDRTSEKNPSFKLDSLGYYSIISNVTNIYGEHNEKWFNPITVHGPTIDSDNGINFTWVQEYGKTSYSVILLPLGITADWDVNWVVEKDGIKLRAVDPTAFTPRYDLPETGIYTVTLSASKDGFISSKKTQLMEIFPNVPPSPEMTMENTNAPYYAGINSVFGYVNQPIQFWSNKSNSMEESWLWDFGDNTSSPLRSPVHSYSAPGLYTVTLKASNVKGETRADISDELYYDQPYFIHDTYNVWILNSIEVNPTASRITGPVPLEVQFDAQVFVNGKSDAESRKYLSKWYWDFGWGTSDEERPSYTYYYPGTYYPYVWVQMINDYYSWHAWPVDTITVTPNTQIDPGFTYDEIDRNGTYGYSYKFMDTSQSYYGDIIRWSWDFDDGSPNSAEPAPTHMFKEPGIYTVTLTVSDSVSPIPNSEKFSKVISVSQNIQPTPIAAFDANIQTGLVPLTVQFADQSRGDIKQWNWNFGDGKISNEQNPKHHYLLPGLFDVSLEVVDTSGGRSEINNVGFIQVT